LIEFILILFSAAVLFGYILLAFHLSRGLSSAGRSFYSLNHQPEECKISVIIAMRNEEGNVKELVDSLAKQDHDNFEIILVDDNSDDRTKSTAEELSIGKANFRVISAGENKFGWGPKKNAIHHGIEQSSGEIIVTTDADCRPEPGWLTGISENFSPATGAVAGFSPLRFDSGLIGRLKSLEALASAIISAAFIGAGRPFLAVGRNFAYRKRLYYELGGFGAAGSAPAGDDDLLIQAIAEKAGVGFTFAKETIVPSFPEAGGYFSRKRRHFNSAKRYKTEFLLIGILVFLLMLCIPTLLIAGIVKGSIVLFISGLVAWQVKIMMDLSLLEAGSKMLGEKYGILDFLIAELIQIPYTLLLQPMSMMGSINWKGRKL